MRLFLSKYNETRVVDITQATGIKTWEGSFEKAPRSLSFNFYRNDIVDAELGDWIILRNNQGVEYFRGIIRRAERSQNGLERKIRVYDTMFFWVKNRDTFTFKNRTLSQIFIEICDRFEIEYGEVAETDFVIPNLVCKDKFLYDVVKNAMSLTYQGTGERYYIRDIEGKPNLLKRVERVNLLSLSLEDNISSFTEVEDAENISTDIKLTSGTGKSEHIITVRNEDLFARFGQTQHYKKIKENYSLGKLLETAQTIARERSKIDRTISLSAVGQFEIISGEGVFLNLPSIDLQKAYYVQSDSHVFDNDEHVMTVSLLETIEIGGVR